MAQGSKVFSLNPEVFENREKGLDIKVLKFIFKGISKYKFALVLSTLCAVGSAVTFMAVPEYLGKLADLFINGLLSSAVKGYFDVTVSEICAVILPCAVFILLNTVFSLVRDLLSSKVSGKYSRNMKQLIAEKLFSLRFCDIDKYTKNKIYDVAMTKADILNQQITVMLTREVSAIFMLAAVIVRLFDMNIAYGVTAILIIPTVFLFNMCLEAFRNRDTYADCIKISLPEFSELLKFKEEIRMSGEKEAVIDGLIKREDISAERMKKDRFCDAVNRNFPQFLCTAVMILCIVGSGFLPENSVMSFGGFLGLIFCFSKLPSSVSSVCSLPSSLSAICSLGKDIEGFFELPDCENGDITPVARDDKTCEIRFENVTFGYKTDCPILNNLSFSVKNRGITVISGKTGSGKTTVLKLMTGFYTADKGKISYNGTDILKLDSEKYRDKFYYVPQQSKLLEKYVLSNIIYPDKTADSEKLRKLSEIIAKTDFPDSAKIDSDAFFTADTTEFSDGQKQLVRLCSAVYKEKEFIVFDEAFSYTDIKTEACINALLKRLSENCGIITVSHRENNGFTPDNTVKL